VKRTEHEKAQLALDVDARRIMGQSTQAACKEVGLSVGNYYAYKNTFGGDPAIKVSSMRHTKKRKPQTVLAVKEPSHIKIPIPEPVSEDESGEVVIKGSPAALAKFFSSIGVR